MTTNNKKILIVEDDQFIREFYSDLLKDEGFEVELALDGQTGLEKIKQGGWSLVLLDIMLPKIDGLQILRKLNVKTNSPGPIIMLTNLGSDSIINEAFGLGAVGYLIKSAMNPDQVLKEIKNFLPK